MMRAILPWCATTLALAVGLAIGDPRESDVDGHCAPDAKDATETAGQPTPVEDVAQYRSEAERGDAEAQTALGLAYQTGEGVDQDYGEALVWLRRAAEQGHAEAQWRLCETYAGGKGVERDLAEAKAWCLPAAEAGHIWAQAELGFLYSRSTPPDYPRALEWYGLASQQGSALARLGMHYIYADGRGIRRDPVKALAYLDYVQFGRMPDGRTIGVVGVFVESDTATGAAVRNPRSGSPSGGMRDLLTRKMSKRQIAEAEQLLLQWTAGEELPDEPVFEYLAPE